MTREIITDLADPRVAVYRSLKATNETRGRDHFVVEGEKLVDRLLASRFPVVSVLATDRAIDRIEHRIPESVPAYVVPFELVHALVGFPFHRGVLGCGRRVPWPSIEDLAGRGGDPKTLVVCPKLSNPENLGTLARIGDAFGIDAILAGPSCPDALSRRVIRVSMGSALRLPIVVDDAPERTATVLRDAMGFVLWAAIASPSAVAFDRVDRPGRLALVLGDEDRGVDPEWLSLCTKAVTIPMRPGAGSLNVAVPAGIFLHHLTRAGLSPRPL